MARKLKITENEKYTLQDMKYGEELKKVEYLEMLKSTENEKYTLQDVKYVEEN